MKLFSGTGNVKLSQEVSQLLNIPLSKAEIIRFANSEVKVSINESVKNEICVIIQPTANPTDTNIMELFFFADALKRNEAKKVVGVIPYFGYARQNIQHQIGECVSANVIVRFLEAIGFSKIYTIDLHDEATEGVFSIPFKNLSALPLLAEKIKKEFKNELNSIKIVSPDQGGIERARKFSTFLFNAEQSIAVIEKIRDLNKPHISHSVALYGDVKNKIVILVDDILTSGRTLVNAAELCAKKGAKKIYAAIVHHDLSLNAYQFLNHSIIERIYTTNTIELKKENQCSKLQEVSIAAIIANELKQFESID